MQVISWTERKLKSYKEDQVTDVRRIHLVFFGLIGLIFASALVVTSPIFQWLMEELIGYSLQRELIDNIWFSAGYITLLIIVLSPYVCMFLIAVFIESTGKVPEWLWVTTIVLVGLPHVLPYECFQKLRQLKQY